MCLVKNVQITILTGFLGSGKTTLINHLLKNNKNEKIAIVENEFGEVNVDGALLNKDDGVEIVELSNGCVCCNIRGELTEALKELIDKVDKNELDIDRLILETTGVADPAPIIQTFFIDEVIRERIVLDGIITLVDAKHIEKQLNEHRVVASQIGFADRVIVTKTDLISDEKKDEVYARINAINSKAEIFEAKEGVLPKEVWLGIGAFELSDTLDVSAGFYKAGASLKDTKFTSFSNKLPTSFSDDIKSFVLRAKELDIKKIGSLMEELIEEYGNDMLRYKGVLAIKDEENRLIVQGVHKVAGFDYGAPFEDDKRESLMVIIGRYLPFEDIMVRFKECEVI